jgi:hypothetical protein
MHYSNLLIVKHKGEGINNDFDLEKAVDVAMGPHEDDGGFWDWYQIGGRWTGTFDGYDPTKDPANQKPCDLCGATGKRTDSVAEAHPHLKEKCNACDGTGIRAEWPTQWKYHEGDVIPVAQLTEDHFVNSHLYEISAEFPSAMFLLTYRDMMASYAGKEVIRAGEIIQSVHDGDQKTQSLDWVLIDIFPPFLAEYYDGLPFGNLWQEWVGELTAAVADLKNQSSATRETAQAPDVQSGHS